MPQSTVEKPQRKQLSPEALAKLALAREKALETRQRNAEMRRLERLEQKAEQDRKYRELKAKYDNTGIQSSDTTLPASPGTTTEDGMNEALDALETKSTGTKTEDAMNDVLDAMEQTVNTEEAMEPGVFTQDEEDMAPTMGEPIVASAGKPTVSELANESDGSNDSDIEEIIVKKKKSKKQKKAKKQRVIYIQSSSEDDEEEPVRMSSQEATSAFRPWGQQGYFSVRR